MKIIIGTKNQAKVAVVSKVLAEYLPDVTIEIEGIDISSGVPDTPRGEETKTGAYNRAMEAAKSADYGIGLESGMVERYGAWFEEAWACIVHEGAAYFGYSSGLPIPQHVLRTMKESKLEHGPAMRQILEELDWPDIRDTWGTYSAKQLSRSISLEEALRNTLIQTLELEHSLYRR